MTPRPLRLAASATSFVALVAGSLAVAATGAQADPDVTTPVDTTLCPGTPVWTGELTPGQTVHGKTTTSGTTIDTFQGTYLSTDKDPFGNDILVFDLTGSRITKPDGTVDAGIWAGISGSPVYDQDNNLIGSVSYGFTDIQGSNTAGVTPARNIIETDTPTPSSARTFPVSSATRKSVQKAGNPIAAASKWKPVSLQRVTVGSSSTEEGRAKLARDSALASKSRLLTKRNGGKKTTFGAAGLVAEDIDSIEPGGNIATSWSYGDLPLAAVGTVTAVCDDPNSPHDKVFAFGHPDENIGTSSQTFLSASATKIIANGGNSYKTANIEKVPEGPLTQDGLNGVVGVLGGDLPQATDITTSTTGKFPQSHQTSVTTTEALSSAVAILVSNEVLNTNKNNGPAEATLSWTINYTPAGGTPATYSRSQKVSGTSFVGEEAAFEVASDVEFLQSGSDQKVTINSVDVDTAVTNSYKALRISKVEYRKNGAWVKAKNGQRLSAKRGTSLPLQVTMVPDGSSSTSTTVVKRLDQLISRFAVGTGLTTVSGGASYGDSGDEGDWEDDEFTISGDEEVFYDSDPLTLAQVLTALKAQKRYDTLLSDQAYRNSSGSAKLTSKSVSTPAVTGGGLALRLSYTK